MGYVFEELIRKFNEAMDENPGEHFTPREVIRLMVNLLLTRDKDVLAKNHIVRTVYDCCCGSGGMLTIAKERICEINPQRRRASVRAGGQPRDLRRLQVRPLHEDRQTGGMPRTSCSAPPSARTSTPISGSTTC